MAKHITAPLDPEVAKTLKVGERVYLSGTIYTARDAAHKRFCECVEKGEPLVFPVENSVMFYVGPTPAAEGHVIGSAGPTTSYRMDAYSPTLLNLGQKGMIGKGKRNAEVVDAMKKNGAVYFGAVGGTGALISGCIKEMEVIAYEDLGAEAVRRLVVEDMPLLVLIDSEGNNLYEIGPREWLEENAED